VTFANEGDEIGNTGQFQDVVFVIKEQKHPVFARDGSNLIFKSAIPLTDALCGFNVEIPSLDGRFIRQRIDGVVTPGSTRLIPNEGMPISKQPGRKGDLIVTFDVIFPQRLTQLQKDKIRQVL
jgi:DnaJ-class molecular chaperone